MKDIELWQGDCFEHTKQIPKNSIDLILTDPPYQISRKSGFESGGAWNNALDKKNQKTPPKTDFGEWDKQELDLEALFKEFYRILKPKGTVIMFYDIWKMQSVKAASEEAKFKQLRLCRWEKSNPVPVNSKLNYLSNCTEYFMTCVKGRTPTFHSEYDNGVYVYPICHGKERTIHTTQKPQKLIKDLILKHSNEGDIVYDPFMGSGTTGAAAKETGRKFIGCEIEKEYFDISVRRIRDTA